MERIRLELNTDFYSLKEQCISSNVFYTNGVLWSLHCTTKRNSNSVDLDSVDPDGDSVDLVVKCEPSDRSMIYKIEADVQFTLDLDKATYRKHKIATYVTDEEPQANSLSCSFLFPDMWGSNRNFNITWRAIVDMKILDILPKLPYFDFKNDHLSDFKFLVGDKTFYVGKEIIAHNAKVIYTQMYGGESPLDGTQVSADRELNHLVINDVDPTLFYKFLCTTLGYKCFPIEDEEFSTFVELSHNFASTRCAEHCEILYFKMDLSKKVEYRENGSDIVKSFVTNLDKKFENVKWTGRRFTTISNFASIAENFIERSMVNGVPFYVKCTNDDQSNYHSLEFKCAYKDKTNLWKHTAIIEYTDSDQKLQTSQMTFTALHPICYAIIPRVMEIRMKIESSSGTYRESKHDFDLPKDRVTHVCLRAFYIRFYVKKQILANVSTYFYSMFYSNFEDATKTVIDLEGVNCGHLEDFLQHVYNPARAVKENELEGVLELSNYFDAPSIRDKCVQYMLYEANSRAVTKLSNSLKRKLDEVTNARDEQSAKYDKILNMKTIQGLDEQTKELLYRKFRLSRPSE